MRIAINARFLLPHKMEGFGWFTYEVVKRLVEQHPEHTFILLFDRPFDSKFVFGENVIPVVISPPARHPILFYIWFEISVRRALKKHKADLFFSPDGYLSLSSTVPQIPVIHDLNFEHYPGDIPTVQRKYLLHYFPKFARKATEIITVSNYSKQDLEKTYRIPSEKITVAWNGVSDAYKPLNETEKAETQQNYAAGQAYFLFVGAIHPRKNVTRLLEAFTAYRRQGGTKSLVIVGENMWKKSAQTRVDSSIKAVTHFTGHLSLESLTKVMGAAFAFIFVPYFEGFGIPLVEAMQSGVPIISGNLTSLPEVAGNAALYVDPFNTEEITSAFFRLENEPETYTKLIENGISRATEFDWDKTVAIVWEVILKTYSK